MIEPDLQFFEIHRYAPFPGAYRDALLEVLWEEFADVNFYEKADGSLVLYDDWSGFEAGTDREDIWHCFDEDHSKGVAWLVNEFDPAAEIPKSSVLPPLDDWEETSKYDERTYSLKRGEITYQISMSFEYDSRYPEADVIIGHHWAILADDERFDWETYSPQTPPLWFGSAVEAYNFLPLFIEDYEKHPILFNCETGKLEYITKIIPVGIEGLNANVLAAEAEKQSVQANREDHEVEL